MNIRFFLLYFLVYLLNSIVLAQTNHVGQIGQIDLAGVALLTVPKGFVFVPAHEFKAPFRNACDSTACLGFLTNRYDNDTITPIIVEILYVETGYVADSTILKASEDSFLDKIRLTNQSKNKNFTKNNCDTLAITSWAMKPYFLETKKQLQWAVFCQNKDTTYTWYSIKKMGRYGFLEFNVRTSIEHLTKVTPQFSTITTNVRFYKGFRHKDFDPKLDKLAAFGIAGLLAGKVLTKVNVVPFAIKWLKWIIIAILGLFTVFKKRLSQKEPQHIQDESDST